MMLHASGEDYLEAILVLEKEKGTVRSIDVARHLDYSKPSISRAIGLLKENGYVTVDDGGLIHLTETGRQVADGIYERHELLTNWLIRLGVSEEIAAEDACKLEHGLSDETFARLKEYIKKEEQ